MEHYNNYFTGQSGHQSPNVANHQHAGSQQQQQQQQPQHQPPTGQIMHSHLPPPNMRQTMPPGHPGHQQQIPAQSQQHLGHHQQQTASQHQNFHQVQQSQQNSPQVSHSNSPQAQQQQQHHHHHQHHQHHHHHHQSQPQHQHHNHQQAMASPMPQSHGMTVQHMHPQSPHHQNCPPIHVHQMNHMVRPPIGHMNHGQPGPQQSIHHPQNFFPGNGVSQANMHSFSQSHPHHQPSMMHHPPPHTTHHQTHPHMMGRSSPVYQNFLQTELRMIEFNRRLQSRPMPRHPVSPLPSHYDEILWWEKFASEFFEDDAKLTLRIHEDKLVEYTIGRTLIPRFFRTYFDGGVTDLSINLRNPKEAFLHPQLITLDCDQTFIITNNIFRHLATASNQSVIVHTEGHLIVDFVNNFDTLSIKNWRFHTRGCREYIDRNFVGLDGRSTMGMAHAYLEPVTRHGLTKSTIFYLKMCMIMEPMQDLMVLHRQTKMDPRACLRKLLYDRFKFRSCEDNRVAANKRRKRKPSNVPAIPGTTNNKKSKSNVNNSVVPMAGLNNNIQITQPSVQPVFPPLASQDVMVVGEPSMMGGDFGDDNERMITRLENTQYDPAASTPLNTEQSDHNSCPTPQLELNSSNIKLDNDDHQTQPPMIEQRQQQMDHINNISDQQPMHNDSPAPLLSQIEEISPELQEEIQNQDARKQHGLPEDQDIDKRDATSIDVKEETISEDVIDQDTVQTDTNDELNDQTATQTEPVQSAMDGEEAREGEVESKEAVSVDDIGKDLVGELNNESSLQTGINSLDRSNHTSSTPSVNEESNSNSQLPCSTPTATSSIEQQPVDSGVA